MRRLLGRANSSNVMKVIWLLEELGLPYQRTDVGGKFGRNDTPDYLRLNPNGLVPTLLEDDFALWESNAILRYVAGTQPTPLWPEAPQARAVVDQWMDWQQTMISPPMSTVFMGLVRTPPEQRDHAAIARGVVQAGGAWALVDAALAGREYVAGGALTLADICLGVHVHRWFNMNFDGRPETPHLRAWYERLLARPAYIAHVAVAIT